MRSHCLTIIGVFLLAIFAFHLLGGRAIAQSVRPVEEVVIINYYPNKKIAVTFTAHPSFPGAQGKVNVEINGGTATIDGEFGALKSPLDIGGQYSAYVLWAVAADGTPQNLGSLNIKGKELRVGSGLKTQTGLKRFGLILTAEPHYLARTPSRIVVLRNSEPFGKNANVSQTDKVKVALSENDYSRPSEKREKKAEEEYRKRPLLLFGAGYAIELAKAAGAQSFASELYNKAETDKDKLDELWRTNAKSEPLDQQARTTIETAAAAEKLAFDRKRERREEQEKSDTRAEIEDQDKQISDLRKESERLRDELARTRDARDDMQRSFEEKRAQNLRDQAEIKRTALDSDKLKTENVALKVANGSLQNDVRRLRGAREFSRDLPELKSFLATFGDVQATPERITLSLR